VLRVHSPLGLFGFSPLYDAARGLSPLWRSGGRGGSLGRRQTQPEQSLYALPGALGAPPFVWGLAHRTLGQIDAIGVDEIQYAKGHKYLTLVYQIDLGVTRLLWVGKERTIQSFQGFFTAMGQQVISKIAFVCSDMWEPYLKLIRQNCSEALHILDRFHIVANMNKALDQVRIEEAGRLKREGRDPVLKKSRWLLLRRSENLGAEQHFRLRDLLRYNLKTVRAYLLKEAFQQLWDYNSPSWAGKFLDLCGHFPYVAKGAGRAVGPLFRLRVRHISGVDQRLLRNANSDRSSFHFLRCRRRRWSVSQAASALAFTSRSISA
jgi:hypothetical protein